MTAALLIAVALAGVGASSPAPLVSSAGLAGPLEAAAPAGPKQPGETPEVPDVPPPPSGEGLRMIAVPVVAYGSDTGWRVAGGVFLYDLGPRKERNDWAAIQLSWTSRGPRYAEIKGGIRRLLGSDLRTFYQLKLLDDVAAPYWGEGADLDGGPPSGFGAPPEPYRYNASGPWLAGLLRGPLSSPLEWFTRVRWTRRNIHDRGEILQAARPVGYEGGGVAVAGVGLLVDTRDEEVGATRGIFADASIFGAPEIGGFSEHLFGGANVTLREYVPLWSGATLALRQMYENKLGDVPFTERTQLEGLGYGEGLGGAGTIRGMARDRIAGEEKALASVELRARVLETSWWGRVQEFGYSVGADAGHGRQRGHGPVHGIGAFAGLRLAWDRAVLVRFEVGHAGQGGAAYYLSFDEPF